MSHVNNIYNNNKKNALHTSTAGTRSAGVCLQEPKITGWFHYSRRSASMTGASPGSLTRKPETLPASSQPNSYQICCLTHMTALPPTNQKIKR
ncbi:hypothetical protein JOB18_018815 [Solea senegalensis]|uniref:Uncharacterized protein n=1 Tax=Solea senegalensis TaxID=28829 RepID=A0AAV6PBL1_SOLSE|nr:hypothetical protein JOB18_018815 [Solea senegalensis]